MKNLSKELFDDVDFRLNIAYAATKLDKIKEKEDSSNDIAEYVYSMLAPADLFGQSAGVIRTVLK